MKRRQVFDINDIQGASEHMEKILKRRSAKAQRSGNQFVFRETQLKRNLLKQYTNDYSEIRDDISTVFISMSSRFRKENEGRIREIAEKVGFSSVITGFDADVGDGHEGKLRPEVMTKILKSNSFLGIWSDDLAIERDGRSIPGVWMPLELGMALSYSKPFALVFHESLERSYLSPIVEFRLEDYRDQRSFDISVEKALSRLFAKICSARAQE